MLPVTRACIWEFFGRVNHHPRDPEGGDPAGEGEHPFERGHRRRWRERPGGAARISAGHARHGHVREDDDQRPCGQRGDDEQDRLDPLDLLFSHEQSPDV